MHRCLIPLLSLLLATPAAAQDDPWTRTPDIVLTTRWPTAAGAMREDRVTAELYRPRGAEGRIPAAVIINSSGGVQPWAELRYARLLAQAGMGALVVDSFLPRGARRTSDDQSRVWQTQSDADAVSGFRWLVEQDWVDPRRIVVLGMSRGGAAALATALQQFRRQLRAEDIRFAAHVAITTGGCNIPTRDARTTGAPIFFMLADLDDATPALPCIDFARRMREAGNNQVRIAVYPGVHHGFEWLGGIAQAADAETARRCAGRFTMDAGRNLLDRASERVAVPNARVRRFLMETCVEHGHGVGGDRRVMAAAEGDLLQFLRDVDVLEDAQARAAVPDCAAIGDRTVQRNCQRARRGWPGDMVALARALLRGEALPRDDTSGAALLILAAGRGEIQAQWELAIMLRNGAGGLTRDVPRALALARGAAETGDAAAMNVLGVMLRDIAGPERDEAAAIAWFRRGAALRNTYAVTNLGRAAWQGSLGVARDRAEAVRLWRQAVALDDNPFAHVLLGEAVEAGEGVPRDIRQAEVHYRAAVAGREQAARRQGEAALARLAR